MAVDDLWYLKERGPDGARLPSKKHGRGKRWRARWVDNLGEGRERLFERKADADRFDANVRADLSRGQYIDDRAGQVTVAALAERWRNDQLHIDSTAIRVEHAIRLHIVPGLGHMQVGQVRPSKVQAWVKDRNLVLAPTTLRVVYGYLGAMFASAVRDRIIASSPCVDIRLPAIDRGKRVIPGPEQVHRLAELMPDRLSAAVYVAAGCGLRLGEVLGLEVGDIDFTTAELSVRQQLKSHKGRPPYLGQPKTKTSVRTVELPDVVAVALREHLQTLGEPVEVDDDTDPRRPTRRPAALLFRGADGGPVIASTFSRTWTPVRAKVGLPMRWGFHGLRHYYATLLIHAGASVKTVQLALGHSTPTITLNEYVHEWPDALDRTRSLVDGALGTRETAATSAGSRA
ncbi:tyrosine-type recombinase/integrase [Actinoplanes awajinensis]|uniref:Integrase n=1 Tax=Actinoplanes awajinensis subsp. mycoplanecinus TaxID=135947 RepID=A0A101JE62_9ACTN|nr:site-specific integrase [Actinoplanes awajinensis]KUL25037.1 integrase [Actinoplanes awajinensis subsp. mycoplanecinus]